VELLRRPIVNHTERGEAIYDPFLALGTTLINAELTGRICDGLDIDPNYVDVIVCRLPDNTREGNLPREQPPDHRQPETARRAETSNLL
jgi:DNA modification methylase